MILITAEQITTKNLDQNISEVIFVTKKSHTKIKYYKPIVYSIKAVISGETEGIPHSSEVLFKKYLLLNDSHS